MSPGKLCSRPWAWGGGTALCAGSPSSQPCHLSLPGRCPAGLALRKPGTWITSPFPEECRRLRIALCSGTAVAVRGDNARPRGRHQCLGLFQLLSFSLTSLLPSQRSSLSSLLGSEGTVIANRVCPVFFMRPLL